VFEAHVHEWNVYLARMNDFWSAALLRTGRYFGRPGDVNLSAERGRLGEPPLFKKG
jgi:hypothetical protein